MGGGTRRGDTTCLCARDNRTTAGSTVLAVASASTGRSPSRDGTGPHRAPWSVRSRLPSWSGDHDVLRWECAGPAVANRTRIEVRAMPARTGRQLRYHFRGACACRTLLFAAQACARTHGQWQPRSLSTSRNARARFRSAKRACASRRLCRNEDRRGHVTRVSARPTQPA